MRMQQSPSYRQCSSATHFKSKLKSNLFSVGYTVAKNTAQRALVQDLLHRMKNMHTYLLTYTDDDDY